MAFTLCMVIIAKLFLFKSYRVAGSAVFRKQPAVSVARGTWGAGLDFDFYYSAIICMVWIWVLSRCLIIFFFLSSLVLWQGHIGLKQELISQSLRDGLKPSVPYNTSKTPALHGP